MFEDHSINTMTGMDFKKELLTPPILKRVHPILQGVLCYPSLSPYIQTHHKILRQSGVTNYGGW